MSIVHYDNQLLRRPRGRRPRAALLALAAACVLLLGLAAPGPAPALTAPGLLVGYITTVAGTGTAGYSVDGTPATGARINTPNGVAVDAYGDVFILDSSNYVIREIAASDGTQFGIPMAAGCIYTVAGTHTGSGYSGDNGPATAAKINASGLATDASGNLYLAESNNYRVRLVSRATGIISTVAGNGTNSSTGDNGPAADATLLLPGSVASDSQGNLFITGSVSGLNPLSCVREVAASDGMQFGISMTAGHIYTVAGQNTAGSDYVGYSGDRGLATSAKLNGPNALALDSAGNLYISDNGNNCIRLVNRATGIITTVAGNGTAGYGGDNGPATGARLYAPRSLAVDSQGNLYIADTRNCCVRRVDTGGTITTVAGGGTSVPGDNGPATAARFGAYPMVGPYGVATDGAGNLYIADNINKRIRYVQMTAPAGLASLNLSGSPSLSYSGTPLTFDLSTLTLTGEDQYRNSYDLTGQTVTWAVYSGPATVSGSTLAITGSGTVSVTATVYAAGGGNRVTSSPLDLSVGSSASTLATLTLSGSPGLSYSGAPFTYDLTGLTLTGADQYGAGYPLTGQTVTWAVYSGPATVSGSALTITGSGTVSVTATAAVNGITSNRLGLTVSRAAAGLKTLTLSGSPSLAYNNLTPLTYDLTGLTLTGADQYGADYPLTGQTVTWAVSNTSPATVSGSILTVTNSGTVSVTATVGGITSNTLGLIVQATPTTSLVIRVNQGSPITVTAGQIDALNPSGTLRYYSNYKSGVQDFYTGLGAPLAEILSQYAGIASSQAESVTVTGSDNYSQTMAPGQLFGNLYYYDAAGDPGQPVETIIATKAQGYVTSDPGQLDNVKTLRLFMGQHGATTKVSHLMVQMVKKIDVTTSTGGGGSGATLATLTLSGNTSLTYSGTPLTYDLSGLTLSGQDQNGNDYSLSGQTVTWAVYSGSGLATVSGHILTITGSGTVGVTASVHGVTSNTLSFTVTEGATGAAAPPALTASTTGSTVSQAVYLSFTDDQAWRGAITGITVNGIALGNSQYTVTAGTIAIDAGVFKTAGDYAITVQATGYRDDSVTRSMLKAAYTVTPATDAAYQTGTDGGVATMTVNTGVTGLKYFSIRVAPQRSYRGLESVVFVHLRNGVQDSINVTRADFNTVSTAQAGFNVRAGDVVQVYVVDNLSNAVDYNPTILQQ